MGMRGETLPRLTRGAGLWRPAGTRLSMFVALMMFASALFAGAGVFVARLSSAALDVVDTTRARTAGISLAAPPLTSRSEIVDAKGRRLALFHDEERSLIRLKDLPLSFLNAVVAIEDQRFYRHDGVDPKALVRAFFVNSRDGRIRQGGGTITMQLARNTFLQDRGRNIERKIDEIILAKELERRMSKAEILERYVNMAYFGSGAYGVQVAAERYFGVHASKLTMAQSALLAGLLRSPSELDPRLSPDLAVARRTAVLDAMVRTERITRAQRDAAVKEPLVLAPRREVTGVTLVEPSAAPFVEYVKQQLLADPRLGATPAERTRRLFSGGLRIESTLDLDRQKAAADILARTLDQDGDPAGSIVSVDPETGEITAMANINAPEHFNVAAQGRRQPGSAFKVFTLVAALQKGISLYDRYNGSSPQTVKFSGEKPWVVNNYEGAASGRITLLRATQNSVNTVYAQVAAEVGTPSVVGIARSMGITSEVDAFPSVVLGALRIGVTPLEMASAYGTLAAGGQHATLVSVRKVTGGGNVLLRNSASVKRVLSKEIASIATQALEQVVRSGTGRAAQALRRPAAAKTGTTDEYRDSWFVGFTPQASTAVWMGYPVESTPMYNVHGLRRVYGGSLPAQMWTAFMRAALDGSPRVDFPKVNLGTLRRLAEPPRTASPSPSASPLPIVVVPQPGVTIPALPKPGKSKKR